MVIGSNKNKLEDIVRDVKSFALTASKKSIKENVKESKKECLVWMMERAGKKMVITTAGPNAFGSNNIISIRNKRSGNV